MGAGILGSAFCKQWELVSVSMEGWRSKEWDTPHCIGGPLTDCSSCVLLCSLVVDSITSPYIGTVERGSPANLISEITNPCVLDHLNLISIACKDHNTLLPPCSASISPLHLADAGLPRSEEDGGTRCQKPGSRPSRVKRMWSMADRAQMALWMGADSSRGGGSGQAKPASVEAICNDRRLYECLRALWKCSALVWKLQKATVYC